MFLESDCYVEYRLAKLVSQSQEIGQPDEVVNVFLEYNPRKEDEQRQQEEDDTEKVEAEVSG